MNVLERIFRIRFSSVEQVTKAPRQENAFESEPTSSTLPQRRQRHAGRTAAAHADNARAMGVVAIQACRRAAASLRPARPAAEPYPSCYRRHRRR